MKEMMPRRKFIHPLLLLSFVVVAVCSPIKPSLDDDIVGLVLFKSGVQDPLGKMASWNADDDSPCTNWLGVKCDSRSNRVTEVVLEGFGLSGRLGRGFLQLGYLSKLSLARNNLTGGLTPGLVQLGSLSSIDLSENGFSGSIPREFFRGCGNLTEISLAKNGFSGKIPESLSECKKLNVVNLSSNRFSGWLNSGIWSLAEVQTLDLSDNLLEGDIPNGIEGMKNLKVLKMGKNRFYGTIPDAVGSCISLVSINFSENSFSGSVPDTMRKLSFCSSLDLRGNSFSFEVPSWIGEMEGLQTLDLSANNFSGKVPSSIGNLQSLKVLNCSANALTGILPESMHNCASLLVLDFRGNLLTGSLPTWIFKSGRQIDLATGRLDGSTAKPLAEKPTQNLQIIDLSHNAFDESIPSIIGDLTGLQVLNLSGNSLIGDIPASVGQLKALVILDLSGNHLNGSIPSEIGGAVSLEELRLDRNLLSGRIPDSLENCSSLTTLMVAHNYLYGSMPAGLAKLYSLQNVDMSFNNLTGRLPKQLADLPRLLSFDISHNHFQGELPTGRFFNTIPPSSVSGNPDLCGAAVNKSCSGVLPKPFVLNPNFSEPNHGSLPSNVGHKKIILSISALVAIGAAVLIVLGVIAITVLNLRVRSSTSLSAPSAAPLKLSAVDDFSYSPSLESNSGKLVMFSGEPDFNTGTHALLNKDCELGRGGFGAVYRAVLRDGRPVAIKKLTVSSLVKSQEDFEREIHKLGCIRHPNLVTLEGYYWTPSLQLLINEFVSGGSLYTHLHESSGGNFLSWNDRFSIILGTAKSMAHLHQLNVTHYNLKSSNVLIDSNGEPKVGDFGLARLLPSLDRYVVSSKIQSALGYMAPEFACRTIKITEKCDVYGFGILVLEVVSGKRPVEYMEDDVVVLSDMVKRALEDSRLEECIDARLHGNFPAEQAIPLIKLGLICTSQVPSSRPDMGEVVNILELILCPSDSQEDSG